MGVSTAPSVWSLLQEQTSAACTGVHQEDKCLRGDWQLCAAHPAREPSTKERWILFRTLNSMGRVCSVGPATRPDGQLHADVWAAGASITRKQELWMVYGPIAIHIPKTSLAEKKSNQLHPEWPLKPQRACMSVYCSFFCNCIIGLQSQCWVLETQYLVSSQEIWLHNDMLPAWRDRFRFCRAWSL